MRGNRFVQPGLGQMLQGQQEFYSRQQTEKLNRDRMRAQAAEHRAKAQRALDPRYQQGQRPAAIQVSEYYAQQDEKGRRLFRESRGRAVEDELAKKGLRYDPAIGKVVPLEGYSPALAERGAEALQATQDVRGATEPGIRGDIERAELGQQLEIRPQITEEVAYAGDRATKTIELNERKAVIPELRSTLADLDRLAETATYTIAGKTYDFAKKEVFGQGSTQGAVDRVEYDSKIANVILPLLKQTFGAAFTTEEGKKLEATLGDVNATPKEKQVAIRAFLKQRENDITSRERELGLPLTNWGEQQTQKATPKKGQLRDGYLFIGGNVNDKKNWKKVK